MPVFWPHRQSADPEFLLLRAYNYWDFPKGLVLRDENPISAAIRELSEETGIEKVGFPWGYVFVETKPYSHPSKIARYYVGEVFLKEVRLGLSEELGRSEHMEFRWLVYQEARKLLVSRVREVLDRVIALIK